MNPEEVEDLNRRAKALQNPNPHFMSQEEIDTHNKRVRETWDPIMESISKLSKETCQEICHLAREEFLAMNQIAQRMRGKVGFEWNPELDVGVGRSLYGHALKMFDLYDVDFRPKPERIEMISTDSKDKSGMTMTVYYLTDKYMFEVEVRLGEHTLRESFRASHQPIFGMDVSDVAQAEAISEKLACHFHPKHERIQIRIQKMSTDSKDRINMVMTIYYLMDKHMFEVEVNSGERTLKESFYASCHSTFGMGFLDAVQAEKIAKKLARQLEEK
jgi:hypothetical protein